MTGIGFFSQHGGEILQATLEHVWLVGRNDASGDWHRRSARNCGGAAAVAFQADSGRRQHRRNNSEPRATWFFASCALARRPRPTVSPSPRSRSTRYSPSFGTLLPESLEWTPPSARLRAAWA